MFAHFVEVATAVRQGGGTISFEWPRYCLGWTQQPVLDFLSSFNMSSVLIDGCAFGMNHQGQPIKKQWRIVTDHTRLLADLSPWTCPRDHKHKEISGSLTPKTAYYNSLMCHVILNAIFPFKMCAHVPAMTSVPVKRSAFPAKGSLNMHRHTDVPSHIDKGGLLSNLSEDIGVVVELDPESACL